MGNPLSYITTFTSVLNAFVAFFLAFKLSSEGEKGYLNIQFRNFFIYFGFYFLLISILVNGFLHKPYLFFVLLEIFHFVLSLGLAYLFSGFVYLRHQKTSKTAFWIFMLVGLAISLFGAVNVNPDAATLNTFTAYTYPGTLYIPKIIYLGIGFIYPSISFLHQGLTTKDASIKNRCFLLSGAFMAWLVGGAMHSRFEEPLFSILGDSLLLVGFVLAGIILLKKAADKKDSAEALS